MAPRNPKLLFLERALKALKKELPDATDAERLQAAQKLTDLEFEPATSRAARETAESVKARELTLQEQAAAEAKAKEIRAATPEGPLEAIIGPKGSDRRESMRGIGYAVLGGGLTSGVTAAVNAIQDLVKPAVSDDLPTPTTDGGKAPLTLKAAEATDVLNAVQVYNQNIRGQARRLYILGEREQAENLLKQLKDPQEVLDKIRADNRYDFTEGTKRKMAERKQELEGEQALQRIREDAENKRKILDLAGQVIKSTEGSMNIDLLPQRQY